jgi:hypothetical protein
MGNIIMDLEQIGWGGVDWIDAAQDRDRSWTPVNTAMKFRVT